MLQYLKQSILLRLIATYGAVFVLGLALTGVFAYARAAKLADLTIDTYGGTVASQLANSSLDAAMQRDMISLQAQLARLLKTRGIVSAAIYDVENHLLAQAGATPSEMHGRAYLHHYSSPMVLGDNGMGSVVVTLDAVDIEKILPQIRWVLLLGSGIVLVLLIVISRHFAQIIRDQQVSLTRALLDTMPTSILAAANISSDNARDSHLPEQLKEADIRQLLVCLRDYVDQVQTPSPAALRDAAAEWINSGGGRAYILLECHNLDLLQRQVSRERLRALLDQFQQRIDNVCRLYNAQRTPVAGSCIKIVIAASTGHIADSLLQAACCAYVLTGVLENCRDEALGIQLQWRLALDWHPPCGNDILRNRQQGLDEQRSQWLCRQLGGGQLAVSAEAGALLQEQDKLTLAVEHGEGGKPFYRVTGFVQTQRVMLDSQIAHLLAS